jgi:glycosyltransferase involved in cell wall biosynthesis
MERSLGVVVPAYSPDIDALSTYTRAIEETLDPAEIRIELDAPGPGVPERLRNLPATVAVADARRGKGAAITHGFEALTTDVFAFADADGSTPPRSLASVIAPVDARDAALAVGSRRHPESTVNSHQTYARRWLGNAFATLARFALSVPLYDFQCGAKAIDAGVWESVRDHLYEPGFAWDLELIAVADALGHRIEEVPIEWDDHPGSTVSPVRTSMALAKALVVVRHRARRLDDHLLHSTIETYCEEGPTLIDRSEYDDD